MMGALILISVAMAQATGLPAVQPQIEVVGPRRSRPICRFIHDTATRIGGYRVCQTPEDRQRELEDNQRDAQDAVRQSNDVHWGSIPFSQFALPLGTTIRVDPLQPHGIPH
jgi:hypothetical protein